jgi:hypothetical protein
MTTTLLHCTTPESATAVADHATTLGIPADQVTVDDTTVTLPAGDHGPVVTAAGWALDNGYATEAQVFAAVRGLGVAA